MTIEFPELETNSWTQKITWELYNEMLKNNDRISVELYFQQMYLINKAIQLGKLNWHNTLHLQHNNAYPHIANMTKNAIQELGLEALAHLPWSPDTHYNFFWLLSCSLQSISFNDNENVAWQTFENINTQLSKWLKRTGTSVKVYNLQQPASNSLRVFEVTLVERLRSSSSTHW